MWASQASSVPNLSASAAMLGASIPSPEFYAAVLAFEPSIAASPSARLRDAIVAPGSDRIFSS